MGTGCVSASRRIERSPSVLHWPAGWASENRFNFGGLRAAIARVSSPPDATPPLILISADQLSDDHCRRIAAAADGWGRCERIAQAPASCARTAAAVAAADIVVGWAAPEHLAAGRTRLYLCGSAGLDGYVQRGLERKPGFRICSAGTVMSATIAEHILTLMLALTRELPQILRNQRAHQWERRWAARELAGGTVCIVGLGGSGAELAKRCRALGMKVIGVRREAVPHPEADAVLPLARLCEAVAAADHVVALVPGGPYTRHLFDDAVFAAMKPGACYYTAARGSVTDEAALLAHLRAGHLGGAGLDVFAEEPLPAASPWWELPNVIVSPHSAGLSHRLTDRLCELMIDNLGRYRRGEPLRHEVDLSTYATTKR
jgi:phosphoglycerate dehydrogenase-like enzyme